MTAFLWAISPAEELMKTRSFHGKEKSAKQLQHTELYLIAKWGVWSRKADFCVHCMLGTPVKNTVVLAPSCWRFVNCSAFSNPTHSAPMVPVVHYYFTKVLFSWHTIRYSETSYGSLIRPGRLSAALASPYRLLWCRSHATSHLHERREEHKPDALLHHFKCLSHSVWHDESKSDCG